MTSDENPYAAGGGYSLGGQPTVTTEPQAPQAAPKDTMIGGAVKDVTTQSFMADVIEASREKPVIVDFWAPWCGPCKQLGPVIEKVVNEAKGAVTLAKMDIEKYPDIAGQMGIQSIPAVVAFIDGRPADAFMGAKPESEVKAFVDKVAAKKPTPEAQGMAEAVAEAERLLADGDHGAAAELFGAILSREPDNSDALAGMGQCYLAVGEDDMAQQILDSVPSEQREKGPLAALAKALELRNQAADLGELAPLASAVESNPQDHQARYDYALALNGAGKREEAAEQLLEIIRKDRTWKDDGARLQLLEFFEAWGPTDPATVSSRRSLSSILFS